MTEVKVKKKRKTLKISLLTITTLIFILVVGFFVIWIISGKPSFGKALSKAPPITIDTSDSTGYIKDAFYLVNMIESTHPIFVIDGMLPDNYETKRDEFLLYSQNPNLTRMDFVFAVKHFITVLKDGHMSGMMAEVSEEGRLQRIVYGGTLEIDWIANDESLFWYDYIVTEVGGVPISKIFETVDRYYYSENEIDRLYNHSRFSRYGDIIERAGGEINNGAVVLQLLLDDVISTMTVPLSFERNVHDVDYIIRYEMYDDIFFIDLRTFVMGDHVTKTVQAIEEAIANGTRKFIVDLRGNGGGNSLVGQKLFEAMGITVPSYGTVRRISPLVYETHDHLWYLRLLNWVNIDYVRTSPHVADKNPNNVFVSVLTDAETYSSANMMGVWVQDGGFGNIIGSPSRQAPTNFGDMLWYKLPYSEIQKNVSFTQWLRPDVNADQLILWPDILIESDNALDVAIEYLKSK